MYGCEKKLAGIFALDTRSPRKPGNRSVDFLVYATGSVNIFPASTINLLFNRKRCKEKEKRPLNLGTPQPILTPATPLNAAHSRAILKRNLLLSRRLRPVNSMTKYSFLTLFLLLCIASTLPAQEIVQVGKASYFAEIPAGKPSPSGPEGPIAPRLLEAAKIDRPAPTNQYWSSLLFPRMRGNAFGNPVYIPPLSLRATAAGFEIGCNNKSSTGTEYHFAHENLIKVSVEGITASSVAVSDWFETGATANLVDEAGQSILAVSFQKSSPALVFTDLPVGKTVSVEVKGDVNMKEIGAVKFPGAVGSIMHAVRFTADGCPCGVFLNKGGITRSETGYHITPEEGTRLTIALLPRQNDEYSELLLEAAGVFLNPPTKPVSNWIYDPEKNVVTFTYALPNKDDALNKKKSAFILLPHQWKLLDAEALAELNKIAGTYRSSRGDAKVFFAEEVKLEIPVRGLLPSLPPLEGEDAEKLKATFLAEYPSLRLEGNDTYWFGKSLQKVISAARIADQLGLTAERDAMVHQVKRGLEDWFTATPGKNKNFFAYDPKWGTLIGYNHSYGSAEELNDHHFHYGYFVSAAAFIAQYDPDWAAEENWGGMVNLLIRDACSFDKNDPLFPWFRCFDLWEGHSWAAGHGDFRGGNNNESSSESMLFNSSVYLWGVLTGNDKLRDLGAFLYALEQSAIEQYWWDVDDEVFPDDYRYCAVGMVWGSGAAHATWFSGDSHCIHGINFLPINASSTYMGKRPDYVKKNYAEIIDEIREGQELGWGDVIYSYWVLGEPDEARKAYDVWFAAGSPRAENGMSQTFTQHWIWSISNYGTVDMSVTADTPSYQVFVKDGKQTYVAWNLGMVPKTVTFSDGTVLEVPAGETVKTVQ